jgi:hypothetical protein
MLSIFNGFMLSIMFMPTAGSFIANCDHEDDMVVTGEHGKEAHNAPVL